MGSSVAFIFVFFSLGVACHCSPEELLSLRFFAGSKATPTVVVRVWSDDDSYTVVELSLTMEVDD